MGFFFCELGFYLFFSWYLEKFVVWSSFSFKTFLPHEWHAALTGGHAALFWLDKSPLFNVCCIFLQTQGCWSYWTKAFTAVFLGPFLRRTWLHECWHQGGFPLQQLAQSLTELVPVWVILCKAAWSSFWVIQTLIQIFSFLFGVRELLLIEARKSGPRELPKSWARLV